MTDSFLLDKEQAEAVSKGSHGDPFSVLGMHQTTFKEKDALVVRLMRPEAERVWIKYNDGQSKELRRISEEGLFECIFTDRTDPFDYTYYIEPYHGDAYEIVDPYAFGPLLESDDLQLWGEGNHQQAHRFMGAHCREIEGVQGTHFVVTAPSATRVSVIGSFNDWDGRIHPMRKYHELGLWELFIPHVKEGDLYKYEILTPYNEAPLKKADPFAFYSEMRPGTASVVYDLKGYDWDDEEWMQSREEVQQPDNPLSIYEVHLGSWMRSPDDDPGFLSYRELADKLVPYVKDLGFTHVELLPIAEYPYDPSWGYQITGYYAPTSRFGTPEDFMYLVNKCHRHDIGVLMDWVPAHFTKDEHGLRRFDGTALFEHEDPRRGEHKDWDTLIFNYGRSEVRNFLISNAVYWCDYFHIDGMRVDAVASMLYLDYSREEGEWVTNRYGGRENLEAIQFLKDVNGILHERYPGFLTMAEESTSWQGVTSPTEHGGLGFDYKWNMGWMNDTLEYFKKDPIYRKYHHDQLTFSLIYAFSENFILPLSHDEVVHMKKSLVSKMPGDDWQKFANLRLLFTYMYGHPGKKLLFMGGEFGQWSEWSEAQSIDWHLLEWDNHRGIQSLIKDLNQLFGRESPLHEADHSWQGFEWIDISDADNCVLSFIRKSSNNDEHLLFLLNFTPEVQHNYKFGVPWVGTYDVILNSDSSYYGGTDVGQQQVASQEGRWHNRDAYIELPLPPLAGMVLKPNRNR